MSGELADVNLSIAKVLKLREVLMRHLLAPFIVLAALAAGGCSNEEPPPGVAGVPLSGAEDPLSGTWTGDWGPGKDNRNPVTLALVWDGTNLAGTVNPGSNAVAITKGAFVAETGLLTFEASGNGGNGKMIHYEAEGKLADGSISGTWKDGEAGGDFKITRSPGSAEPR